MCWRSSAISHCCWRPGSPCCRGTLPWLGLRLASRPAARLRRRSHPGRAPAQGALLLLASCFGMTSPPGLCGPARQQRPARWLQAGGRVGAAMRLHAVLRLCAGAVGRPGGSLLQAGRPADPHPGIGHHGADRRAVWPLYLIFSSPFDRQFPGPLEGRDLNPHAAGYRPHHPPALLYLGYVGFAVNFAFAMAALHSGRLDGAVAPLEPPWALGSWVFLTAGIVLGSWWAYYELGWGGWWFWDPVEMPPCLPWLLGTACCTPWWCARKARRLRPRRAAALHLYQRR